MDTQATICVICKEDISDGQEKVTLTRKGCDGINVASNSRGESLNIVPGQTVHKDCRRTYCNIHVIARDARKKESTPDTMNTPRSLRSHAEKFDFPEHCLFCGLSTKVYGQKRGYDVWPVRTHNVDREILAICDSRGDEWAHTVRGRMEYVAHDLHAADAVYHQTCNVNFRTGKQIPKAFSQQCSSSKQRRGRPADDILQRTFIDVVSYLEENDNEQITISDLVNRMHELCGDSYSVIYMKKKLEEHFRESIIITEINGKQNVVTLRNTASSILHDFYKRQKTDDSQTEKLELLKAAAKLIQSDIKAINLNKIQYSTPEEISSELANFEYLPESLRVFLRLIFSEKNARVKIASVGQAIMQASRPRVLIAPLQIGLGVQLHHHFASKFLIDTLYNMGFCISYSEIQKYESSAAVSQGTDIVGFHSGQFIQYSADNADHNIRTLDGHNTFHGMGMIACVTPGCFSSQPVLRQIVSTEQLVSAGSIDITYFKQSESVKPYISFAELQDLRVPDQGLKLNFLAKVTWPIRSPGPEWSGFMQMIHEGEHPGQSSVTFLPMIDMNPSDMSCILSTLHYLSTHARKHNQSPVITFDQPLYWKALTILQHENDNSDLQNVVLRLGGFHTEMSFLGCIGHLMQGSGLTELLETVYASNAVVHMLNGKAVARALRGHFLVENALYALLASNVFGIQLSMEDQETEFSNVTNEMLDDSKKQQMIGTQSEISQEMAADSHSDTEEASSSGNSSSLDQERIAELRGMFEGLMAGNVTVATVCEDELLTTISQEFEKKREDLKQYPTAALWIQYLDMIQILKTFIKAERTGEWELSLYSLQQMLPYFAAAGHNLYLKSAHVYLQTMCQLRDNNPRVYEAFKKGHHVIRRSDRYWAGLSTDLVIEQVLMRSVKTTGGMTRGKGMSEYQRAQWLLSMPACAAMNVAMQTFCGTDFHTSSQHKDTGKSRMERDYNDSQTFLSFLTERNPFCEGTLLRNIETGITSDSSVNAYKAVEIGNSILQAMIGKNIFDYSFKKSSQAVTPTTTPTVTLDGDIVHVDPQLLFQRLTAAAQRSAEDIPQVFTYELCSVPSSLFDTAGFIREPQKPALADAIWGLGDCSCAEPFGNDIQFVLDGGSLLQRIPWSKGTTFSTICNTYVNYVTGKYNDAVIVFDGYRSGPTTKDTAHLRRTKGITGAKVYFTQNTPFKTKKEQFLSNSENKQDFIFMLSRCLEENGCNTIHAEADADVLIVQTAVKCAENRDVALIGEDTDLLVLLCYHANLQNNRIFFKSEPKQKLSSKCLRVWDIKKTKELLGPNTCHLLPFIHAFTGCDTTSRIYGISKGAALKKLTADQQLKLHAETFLKESTKCDIVAAGEGALVSLYGGIQIENLNLLRFRKFANRVMTSSSFVQVCTLPPTSSSAKYHSMRVYHQVQEWTKPDNTLQSKDWGWYLVQNRLLPKKTDLPAAPDNLLKMVKCSCKQNCDTKRCTCRKHGLDCSIGCSECRGMSCTNTSQLTESDLTDAL